LLMGCLTHDLTKYRDGLESHIIESHVINVS